MTENKNQNQNFQDFLQEEGFEEELFNIDEEEQDNSKEKEVVGNETESEPFKKDDLHEDHPKDANNKDKDEEDVNEEEENEYISKLSLEDKEKEEEEGARKEDLSQDSNNDRIYFSRSKILLAKKLIRNIKENNDKLEDILNVLATEEETESVEIKEQEQEPFSLTEKETQEGKVVEGVFNGINMIGPDGQSYTVPANYASKSKLVEGDVLKLTITPSGGFVYKQIQLVERKRVVGTLQKTKEEDYIAYAKGKVWKLLPAGVTYFKGEPGDEVIFLIPEKAKSKWGAVENIVKK